MEYLKYGVGWVIGILGAIASYYYFFSNNRRKTLGLQIGSSSLIAINLDAREELEVRFKDRQIVDPYIVILNITNLGSKDITSKDFDADKPLVFHFDASIVARMQASIDNEANMSFGPDGHSVLLLPAKIAAGTECGARFLVDGIPNFSLEASPLIDTDIVVGQSRRTQEEAKRSRMSRLTFGAGFLLVITAFLMDQFKERIGVSYLELFGISHFLVIGPIWLVSITWILIFTMAFCGSSVMYQELLRRRKVSESPPKVFR